LDLVLQLNPVILPGNPTSSCSVSGPIGPAPIGRSALVGVVNGTNVYTDHQIDHTHWERAEVTRMFTHDTTWLYLDPVDDAIYQQYLLNEFASSTGRLVEAEMALAVCDSAGVTSSCNAVLPSCQKESDLTAIYSLLTDKYLTDYPQFNNIDSTWLWDLACSDALTTGAAVYSARAVLTWPFGCVNQDNRNQTAMQAAGDLAEKTLTVYPNPTNDVLNLSSNLSFSQIIIRDVSGKVVFSVQYNDAHFVQLDLNHLSSGMYLVELLGDGYSDQIKLIKQ
jgi:hypothetical protein